MEVSLPYVTVQRKCVERQKLDLMILPMHLDILSTKLDISDFQVKLSSKTRTMPCIIDKWKMCTSGEQMKFVDCFIINVGMLWQPATLRDWNWFAIARDFQSWVEMVTYFWNWCAIVRHFLLVVTRF